MPKKFGGDTTWLKGKREDSDSFEYVNLYQIQSIQNFNTNDYLIQIGGLRFVLKDCVVLDDLAEIQPPEPEEE